MKDEREEKEDECKPDTEYKLTVEGRVSTVEAFVSEIKENHLPHITAASHALVASGGRICSDYLSISRSDASPASTWYAGANSTDGLNNSGWVFEACPDEWYCVIS